MRHGNKVNKLNRTASHRKAMLSNMANSLIIHKRIKTTLAKAKALRLFVEPLITKAKTENNTTIAKATHHRRTVFSYLQNKEAIKELFGDIADKVGSRNGGYTRIIKLGTRLGDNAEVCIIELVDFNETYQKEEKAAKKSRRRKRSKKKTDQVENVSDSVEEINEADVVTEDLKAEAEEVKAEVEEVKNETEDAVKKEEPKDDDSNKDQ